MERITPGLYYPDGSFQTDEQIKQKLQLESMKNQLPVFHTPLPTAKDFDYWSDRFEQRQKQYAETADYPQYHVEISLPGTSVINFIGDTHVGAPRCDYGRIKEELELIVRTPRSYVLLMGDAVDGYFFNGAQMEQIEQTPEQFQYAQAMINYLAAENRLLVAWAGDHDSWHKKMGVNAYSYFSQNTNAHFMYGVGFVTLNIGEQTYKIAGAHRFPGSSVYNKVHSAMRAEKFGGAKGADIVVNGHTHQKGYACQPVAEFGGVSRNVHFINVGPYKHGDDYADKLGLSRQNTADLYGSAVILDGKTKEITFYDDVIRANKLHTRLLEE